MRQISGDSSKLTHHDATLTIFTANIHPASVTWPRKKPVYWTVETPREIQKALVECSAAVAELGVPYLDQHEQHAALKATLIDPNGRHSYPYEHEPLIAMDYLGVAPLSPDNWSRILRPQLHPDVARRVNDYRDAAQRLRERGG
jgi:hypothetical protein